MSILIRSLRACVFLSIIAFLMIGSVLLPGSIRADTSELPQFSLKWGESGSGSGRFGSLADVATDSLGNVYVLDEGGSQVQKFDSNGTFITQWGSLGNGSAPAMNERFYYPTGIAVDSTNNVYVVDTGNNYIKKFDSNGTFITKWGGSGDTDGRFMFPQGIAIDAVNNVYVADTENSRIQKFDSNGTFITKWGNDEDGLYPRNLTVSNNYIFVVEDANNRIQKFDSNGTFITKWGTQGSGDGQFDGATGVTSDRTGDIYVSDMGNNRIQKFDSNGTFITKWGTQGSGDGQFDGIAGIDFYRDNTLYATDIYNTRIQKFVYPEVEPPVDPPPESANDPTIIPNATDGKSIVMTPPEGITLLKLRAINPQSIADDNKDGRDNVYPLGLVGFTLDSIENGATINIELFFETNLSAEEVTPRKYISNTFSDLPGATVIPATFDGKSGLRLNYSVTDGGDLDQDGVANGAIVDPVGLAVKSSSQLANTGVAAAGLVVTGVLLVISAAWTYVDYKRHKRPLAQADPYLASTYTYLHHIRVVTVPALRYRLRIRFDYVEKIPVR